MSSSIAHTSRAQARRLRAIAPRLPYILGAALMFGLGAAKFVAASAAVSLFASLSLPSWSMYAVGAVEIFGAILLTMPRGRGVGALIFSSLMLGAVGMHAAEGQWVAMIAPAVLFAFFATLLWRRRDALQNCFQFAAVVL